MGKIKFYAAMLAAKLAYLALKMLGRNATYLPGEIAVHICPDFIGYLKKPETVICVTGTNGKTTTSNLLNSVLTECGYDVLNNSLGSNVHGGIASALLCNSTFSGKPKKQLAVLEVDERSSLLVYKHLTPDYLVINNIMRDSIKRNAHTEFISYILNTAVPAETKVILNADDIICASLVEQCKNRTYFGVDAEAPDTAELPFVRDIVYCPKCGGELKYDYIRFNHIGRCKCEKCGWGSPARDFTVTEIDRENSTFTVTGEGKETVLRLVNDNIVNVFNCCGAFALLTRFGLSAEQIKGAFEKLEIVKTRLETVSVKDVNITMLLAKGQNPVATTRCFAYAAGAEYENKSVLLMNDDKEDNTNNSENTCWLYDCDFSYFSDESVAELIIAGPRAKDTYLRALIAGVDASKIKICDKTRDGALLVDFKKCKEVFVLYDNYRMDDAEAVKKTLVSRIENEE